MFIFKLIYINYIKILVYFFLISKKFRIKNLEFLTFNGRTVCFKFYSEIDKKYFFIKKYIKNNKVYNKLKIKSLLKNKINLIEIFNNNNIISYNSLSNDKNSFFLRNFINGDNLSFFLNNLSDNDKKIYLLKLFEYIDSIIQILIKNKLFYILDLKFENFLISENGKFNIIDLDTLYETSSEDNFKEKLYFKFIKKCFIFDPKFNLYIYKAIINRLENKDFFNELIINSYFYKNNNVNFDHFFEFNYKIFNEYNLFFNENIKSKLISTISKLDKDSYTIARRYNWLINKDENFDKTKDIDIFILSSKKYKIIEIFKNDGWDVNDNIISQFFINENLFISIDLVESTEKYYNLKFKDILAQSDNYFKLNVVNEDHYKDIMNYNFFKKKKFIKKENISQINKYIDINSLNNQLKKKLNKKFYYFNDKYYYNLSTLIRRIFSNIIKKKNIVLIGADGSGKTTFSKFIFDNLQLYCDCEIKYISSFFYPSGRTNLNLIKTSVFFKFLIYLKKNKNFFYKDNSNKVNNKTSTLRSLHILNNRFVILFNYFFLPFLIVDAWLQHFIYLFSNKRILIYDRFYNDIIINFQNSFTRKIISKVLPKSNYTLYLYANPLTNFNRKKQESIELIMFMKKCYEETNNYFFKIPTDINNFIYKKKIIIRLINII